MTTNDTIVYKLGREIDHISGAHQTHEHAAPHHEIAKNAEEMYQKATFALERHGENLGEVLMIDPFLPITLEDGNNAFIGLVGNLGPKGAIESVSCIVTVKDLDISNTILFEITGKTLAWWDKRGVSTSDIPFMSATVGEIYNRTFVPAGQ